MSNYLAALNLDLPAESPAAKLRHEVLASTPWAPAPTTHVAYTAANRLLIIADPDTAERVAAQLPDKLLCYTATPSPRSVPGATANAYHCAGLSVSGYLGRFRVTISDGDDTEPANLAALFRIESGFFDQVLDGGDEPLMTAAIKPPGYHRLDRAASNQAAAIANIPELIGEFEKPKYFDYNPDICAHSRSGVSGCTRCLDACPTGAIFSITDAVEVDSHLCQGIGACAGSCPTGAIGYVYPRAAEQIELLRVLLKALRQKNGQRGVTLLVFDNEHGRESIQAAAARADLDGHILPFMVEEIGSAGLDTIAAALAYGANRVCLYAPADTPAQAVATLQSNLAVIAAVLEQTNYQSHRAEIITDLSAVAGGETEDGGGVIEQAATFAPAGDKRSIMRAALSFFSEISPHSPEVVRLPAGAPFGQIQLDAEACTLCMGCVSVCPAGALQAGGDAPALKLIEANCVQCGICANACPERAVTLESRLLFDSNAANTPRALKEEAPFRCIQCAKPFATQSMITRMTEKLKGHWMFAEDHALRRLQMCEDCRVKDLFDRENTVS